MSAPRLSYFPITLFGAIMGYAGLTLVFREASSTLGMSSLYYHILTLLTLIFFTFMMAAYLVKLMKFLPAVKQEFFHPVASHFFAAISISLMLLSVILVGEGVPSAQWLWMLGASLHLVLTLTLLNYWLFGQGWNLEQLSPAWFLPMVGNLIAPLGAVHFASIEVAWFFFSIGFFFWLVLQILLIYRLLFHPSLPAPMQPLLFILLAPPAIGFLSYLALNNDQLDSFARVLYYLGLFFTFLLFTRLHHFIRTPFSMAWWAYSFPLAAMANASLVMYQQLQLTAFAIIGGLLGSLLLVLVMHLTLKTFRAIANKKLCLPPNTVPSSTNTVPNTKAPK